MSRHRDGPAEVLVDFQGTLALCRERRGGERAARFVTLVSSALRNDLDVGLHLTDVLTQPLEGSRDRHSLLPHV